MKKIFLILGLVLMALSFSLCTKDTNDAQLKKGVIAPDSKPSKWEWVCHACKATGTCLCGEGMCEVGCTTCGTALKAADWSKIDCYQE